MNLDLSRRRQTGLVAGWLKRVLHLRGEEGNAILEFAIMLPILLIVLTGTASFAMAFYELQELQNATSSAVQSIAGTRGTDADPCAQVMAIIQAALPDWTAGNFTYTLKVTNAAGGTTAYDSAGNGGSTGYTCTPAGANGTSSTKEAQNEPVELQVSYPYNWMPIITALPGMHFSPSSPLTADESEMAN
jgi:Flp pilus assembly protein TadG